MLDRVALGQQLIAHAADSQQTAACRCFVGFDGFTDEIVRVVDARADASSYHSMTTMRQFGDRVNSAAGKSCNIELVTTDTRVGGNAPLMTLALLEGGHAITFAGAVGGDGGVEPIFETLAARCKDVIPLCRSGHTDALEFEDGKILLGKMGPLVDIDYARLTQAIPEKNLVELFDQTDLFASVNWTMLPHMTDLWRALSKNILPRCSQRTRWMFVDLADTAKRSKEDLFQALEVLRNMQPTFKVVLGLNHAELEQVHEVLGGDASTDLDTKTKDVQTRSGLEQIVVHSARAAWVGSAQGLLRIEVPHFSQPRLVTGAGDHFNGGYCNALLYGLDYEACLATAVATAGFYVSQAKTPSMRDVADFLEAWQRNTLDTEAPNRPSTFSYPQ